MNWELMKRTLIFILLLASWLILSAQAQTRQQGTIIRMSMTDCMEQQHRFMAAMSGNGKADEGLLCPEYVLVTDKVVYVISGRGSAQLLPLAEVTRFRLLKNEMLIRADDERKESHFHIKAMVLRPEWERSQMLMEAEATAMVRHHLDAATTGERQ